MVLARLARGAFSKGGWYARVTPEFSLTGQQGAYSGTRRTEYEGNAEHFLECNLVN